MRCCAESTDSPYSILSASAAVPPASRLSPCPVWRGRGKVGENAPGRACCRAPERTDERPERRQKLSLTGFAFVVVVVVERSRKKSKLAELAPRGRRLRRRGRGSELRARSLVSFVRSDARGGHHCHRRRRRRPPSFSSRPLALSRLSSNSASKGGAVEELRTDRPTDRPREKRSEERRLD